MGIQGLLPLLKAISESTNIDAFKGKVVGIDASCWCITFSKQSNRVSVIFVQASSWGFYVRHRSLPQDTDNKVDGSLIEESLPYLNDNSIGMPFGA